MNNYCPNCGRREGREEHTVALKRDTPDVGEREVRVPMSCPECGTTWTAVYIFSGPEEVAVPA
jgi:uncharacterized Zn finger protein